MSDDLAKLPPTQLAGFYRRLATAVDGRKRIVTSISGQSSHEPLVGQS
jgi:hypothetical protein